MTPVLIVAPVGPLVSLADLKAQCRVLHPDDDAALIAYADAALAKAEIDTGRVFLPQTWRQPLDRWGSVLLRHPDVIAARVGWTAGGVTTTVTADVALGPLGAVIAASGPAADARWVEYDLAPDPHHKLIASQAVRMLVAHWYRTREAVGEAMQTTPLAYEALIQSIRRMPL